MKTTKEGKPIIGYKNFEFIFTNPGAKKGDTFSMLFIKDLDKKMSIITDFKLKEMKTKMMSAKEKNEVVKKISKFVKDGAITLTDVKKLADELETPVNESIINKLELLLK